MRRETSSVAVAVLLLTLVPHLGASAPETGAETLPKFILSGLKAYEVEGLEAAVTAWTKGSTLEGSKETLEQANVLRQVQDLYGSYKTFHFIQSRKLSPTSRIIYLALDYEKGPLFAKFQVFRGEQGWTLTSFMFNTHPEQILPDCR